MQFIQKIRGIFATTKPESSDLIDKAVLEERLGLTIKRISLYEKALTHRSMLRGAEKPMQSNERIEFLGDAVVGLIIGRYLFEKFPEEDEGFLTRARAKVVNGKSLAQFAHRINLGELILMSDNAAKGNGRNNDTILADAFEAVVGAIYLDRGYDIAEAFVLGIANATLRMNRLMEDENNYKSLLLEYMQARAWGQPEYRVISEEGPSHSKAFEIEVWVCGEPKGRGTATSKKRAEQLAAENTLAML
jgi:ribonuclease III